MHVLWSKFHNLLLDFVAEDPEIASGIPPGSLFDRVRTLVTWHYQWIVWNDFLPHIVRKAVLDEVKAAKLLLYDYPFTPRDYPMPLPVEFTMAAFRFGHSMVQENYRINRSRFAEVKKVLALTEPGGGIQSKLPAEFVVDWRYFFSDTMLNFGQNIDTFVTEALYELELGTVATFRAGGALREHSSHGGNKFILPELTLTRGSNSALSSGEQFASFFEFPKIDPSLIPAFPVDQAFFDQPEMRNRTPLWYYLLREAAIEG